MTKLQRITTFLTGLVTALVSLLIAADPENGISAALVLLGLSLAVSGIKYLVYYLFMARYMVGGRAMLYVGMIVLDFGVFTFTLVDSGQFYVMLYLFGTHLFAGVIDILRSMESRKMDAPSWKLNISRGAVNIVIAVLCIIFIFGGFSTLIVYTYCAGLFYSACIRIISAFRRTQIVFIQ